MDEKIAYKRICFVLVCALTSASVFFIPENIEISSNVFTDLITVISILCGVLIAVISILGEQPDKLTSQGKTLHTKATDTKMERLKVQFHLYLIVIVAALACNVFSGDGPYYMHLKKLTLFIGCLSILTSFSLPHLLSEAFRHTRVNR